MDSLSIEDEKYLNIGRMYLNRVQNLSTAQP